MKKYLLTLAVALSSTYLYAQKIEVSAEANSGLFHYAGQGTSGSSYIIQEPDNKNNYINNPYGNKNGFGYGFDIKTQYIHQSGFIIGLQAGYDILRSKTAVTSVYPYYPVIMFTGYLPLTSNVINTNAAGSGYLQDQFINLSPYLGYRFNIKKIKLDVLPGADIAINTSSYDKGNAISPNGDGYQTNLKLADAPTDIRIKLGAAATYNRFGLTISYAYGLTNYEKNMVGDGTYIAKSRLFKFGISYRIF